MKKHFRYWLEQLPEPYRTQALDNINPRHPEKGEVCKVQSMQAAITVGLKSWQATPQGFDYWRDVYNLYSCKNDRMTRITEPDNSWVPGMGAKMVDYIWPNYMPTVYRDERHYSVNPAK